MLRSMTTRFTTHCLSAALVTAFVVGGMAQTTFADSGVDMSPIPADPKEERVQLRSVTRWGGEGFKLKRSQHYSIIYDTSEEDVAVFQRGIERTYRWCMRYCKGLGIPTHKPAKKLVTHFFDDVNDYILYGYICGSPGLTWQTLGFYTDRTNYTYFYNFRNMPAYKAFRERAERQIKLLAERLKGSISAEERAAIREQIKQLRITTNFTVTDGGATTEETLQHEVAHQVLFNIGFHNQRAGLQKGANPRWLAEGIAQLFEPVGNGKESGFGVVNRKSRDIFLILARREQLFPMKVFVSGWGPFGNPGIAYPQAWALVHYLTRMKRDELVGYLNDLNARPPEFESTPEQEIALFEKHFGQLNEAWEEDWKDWIEDVH